jgi:hypothetical protein
MRLVDGFDLIGKAKTPFATRVVEFRAVDPSEWKRRIPELLSDARDVAASRPALPAPRNPQIDAMVERLNALFAKHTDYLRLRLDEVLSLEAGGLYGVTAVTLITDRDSPKPRLDETIHARRLTLTHRAAERRLEIEFEDGTRGRDRQVPFPGNKLHFFLPGVDAAELEGGDTPLPIQRQ